jgi:rod shape-determining protein MreC
MLAIWGLARQDLRSRSTSFFERVMIETFAPIQAGTVSLKDRLATFFDHYIFLINTSIENEQLSKEVSQYRSELFKLSEVEKENKRLKKLLQFGEELQHQKVLAQVIGWDSSNEFKVLRINKGKRDGIQTKYPVITADGLVGYVFRVSNNYSDILTILDQNNRVDALVATTRSHGIVEGSSGQLCFMKYVPRTETIEIDDVVITAGLGDIYPKGIKVGKISKVEKESYGITQYIEVTPSVDFRKLEEVVILTKPEEYER